MSESESEANEYILSADQRNRVAFAGFINRLVQKVAVASQQTVFEELVLIAKELGLDPDETEFDFDPVRGSFTEREKDNGGRTSSSASGQADCGSDRGSGEQPDEREDDND